MTMLKMAIMMNLHGKNPDFPDISCINDMPLPKVYK